MQRQRYFPPRGTTTRRVFIAAIVVLAVGLFIAGVVGPVLVAGGADPRPFAAAMSVSTYLATALVIGWLVWFVLRKPP